MLPIYYINAKKTTNFVAVKEKGETDWKYYSGADVLMIFDMNGQHMLVLGFGNGV